MHLKITRDLTIKNNKKLFQVKKGEIISDAATINILEGIQNSPPFYKVVSGKMKPKKKTGGKK